MFPPTCGHPLPESRNGIQAGWGEENKKAGGRAIAQTIRIGRFGAGASRRRLEFRQWKKARVLDRRRAVPDAGEVRVMVGKGEER